MLKNEKRNKRLDFKCDNCKKRFNLGELNNLGYITHSGAFETITCPSCDKTTVKKKKK